MIKKIIILLISCSYVRAATFSQLPAFMYDQEKPHPQRVAYSDELGIQKLSYFLDTRIGQNQIIVADIDKNAYKYQQQ